MQEGHTEIQEVTLAFENLSINLRVTVRHRTPPAGSGALAPEVGFEVVSEAGGPEPVPFEDPHHISFDLEEQVLAAETAAQLSALPLGFLQHLTARLRGSDRIWTPRARIGRAFRAGVAAYRRFNGEYQTESSPGIPFRNQIYIILRSPNHPLGGWTSDYSLFIQSVQASTGQGFHRDSVCHSFPSQIEVDAYLAGARRPWPTQLHP